MAGKYFSLHHWFLAWVGRATNTIILLPHPVSIGNASEDYYFGLLKARREGKKLVILFPFQMPERLIYQPFLDPAILSLETDLLAMKFKGPISSMLGGIFTLYWIVVRRWASFLYRFFKIKMSGYYWRPLAGQDVLWRPSASQTRFDWDLACEQDWGTHFSTPLKLSLGGKIVASCEVERDRIGLPRDAWFVCLHVREGGYKGDWESPVNANISNYVGAIKEITQRGGWVVRLGDPSMTRLPKLERVIDYPFSSSKSAIMDVYLMKECSFVLCTCSSILDTAFLLDKPVVMTNSNQWVNTLPLRHGDSMIFKHIYSRTAKRFIPIKEWLNLAANITEFHLPLPDCELIENNEEEITSVVKERLDFSNDQGPTELQQEFRKAHLRAVQEMSKTFRFSSSEVENCNEWFRFGARMLGWGGEISAEFLEKNWSKSSRTPN